MPTLALHGTLDKIVPYSHAEKLAAAVPGARLVSFEGAGHMLHGRHAVKVNHLIRDFVLDRPVESQRIPRAGRAGGAAAAGAAPARRTAQRRVLWLSSPSASGTSSATSPSPALLREINPDVSVDFLAADPANRVVEAWGERVHPATALIANESAHFEGWARDHELHAFNALWDMDEIMAANFMTFADVVERERYDLWVGDEGWDLDYFLHENPELKRAPYVFMTDFIGMLPMREEPGSVEFKRAWEKNAENIDHLRLHPDVRDLSIMVGDEGDVLDREFGPDLPNMRQWSREHFRFSGYTYHFDPADYRDKAALRRELGFRDDERVILVSAGGTRVGQSLLRKCVEAFSMVASKVRDARMIVVAGPRLDADELPRGPQIDVRAIRAAPLPSPRRRPSRHRPGRAHHHHGAGRVPDALPLFPAAEPLRAELPRRAPAGSPRGGRAHGLRPHEPRGAGRGDSRSPRQARAVSRRPRRRHRARRPADRQPALSKRRPPWHSMTSTSMR